MNKTLFPLLLSFLFILNFFFILDRGEVVKKVEIPYIYIYDEAYGQNIYLFIEEVPSKVLEYTSYRKDAFEGNGGITIYEDGNIIVWLCEYDRDVLVHELFHVCEMILSNRGIGLNESTSEVYAYELDYLNRIFEKKIKLWLEGRK